MPDFMNIALGISGKNNLKNLLFHGREWHFACTHQEQLVKASLNFLQRCKIDSLTKEILVIGIPAAIAVAADPLASLIDTAFIGHLGPVELAATGASIALFNQALRITVFPLVSITTSFVAEEDTREKINALAAEKLTEITKADQVEKGVINETPKESLAVNGEIKVLVDGTSKSVIKKGDAPKKKRRLASASTALLFGLILGLFQAALLIFAEKPLLFAMGLKHNSPMLVPAGKYLRLRALGSPAVLLSMVCDGVGPVVDIDEKNGPSTSRPQRFANFQVS
ncbi:unnamed protein product [Lupinus luteus]|uniref:Uncharacterized protein n=1 Tax=Lupinus luteus TaxID=3873 RepID=A0AAV1XYM6_LUPLU